MCLFIRKKKIVLIILLSFSPSLSFHLPIWKFIFYLLYLDTKKYSKMIANFFYPMLDDENFLALSKRVMNFLLLIIANLSEILFILILKKLTINFSSAKMFLIGL